MGKFVNINRKRYLGKLVTITFICGILLPSATVFAGSLNSEEARLIRSVSITYEYEGKSYQVKDEYLGKLRAYLMQDDVDLSAQEVNELIPQAMSNVATGVADGYLMEIPKKEDIPQEEIMESGDTETTTESSQEETKKDNNTEEDAKIVQNEEDATNSKELSSGKDGYHNTDILKNSEDQETTQPINTENKNEITDEVTEEVTDTDNSDLSIDVKSNRGDVIKQTGFSIRVTVLSGGAILLVFAAALLMAYRVSLVAHEDA